MPSASKHPEEARRLAALHALRILDTDPEERFDRITRLAQRLFDTQMSAITLIDSDRQWFKSEVALGERRRDDRREAGEEGRARRGGGVTTLPPAFLLADR